MTIAYLIAGFALLILGGDLIVRGAVKAASALNISPLLIGLTLVGFGTSMPELVTSVQAALAGSPGIAIGNVVGSNIANILLILGLAAIIFPVAMPEKSFWRDGIAVLVSTIMCLMAVMYGYLNVWIGGGFIVCLAAYISAAFMSERAETAPIDAATPLGAKAKAVFAGIFIFAAGLAIILVGAKWLVASAVTIAGVLGLSETIIGLTIVAIGTSLPELVTTVIAALRKQGDMAFGNIVGSNVYNIFGILGVTAIIKPFVIPTQIAGFDIWVMFAAAALLLIFGATRMRITRLEGMIMLLAYTAYTSWLIFSL